MMITFESDEDNSELPEGKQGRWKAHFKVEKQPTKGSSTGCSYVSNSGFSCKASGMSFNILNN